MSKWAQFQTSVASRLASLFFETFYCKTTLIGGDLLVFRQVVELWTACQALYLEQVYISAANHASYWKENLISELYFDWDQLVRCHHTSCSEQQVLWQKRVGLANLAMTQAISALISKIQIKACLSWTPLTSTQSCVFSLWVSWKFSGVEIFSGAPCKRQLSWRWPPCWTHVTSCC